MRLRVEKVKNNPGYLTRYTILFCRGRGHARRYVCDAHKGYISAHPYHSYNDITAASDICLYGKGEMLLVTVDYHETGAHCKVLNRSIAFYQSKPGGATWEQADGKIDPAGYETIQTLTM